MFFFMIMGLLLLGDVAWWLWADLQLRRLPRRRLWRSLLAIFNSLWLGYLLFFLLFPWWGRVAHHRIPPVPLACVYVWHIFVLPITIFAILAYETTSAGTQLFARFRKPKPAKPKEPEPDAATPKARTFTRRQALAGALVAAPPLLMGGMVTDAMSSLGTFRLRKIELAFQDLPGDLDGLTIAHLSDIHVGRFTRPSMLPRMIETMNQLKADLVAFTGDLIDLSLADLPAGIDMMKKLDPRHGMFMVEGNHDLIEEPGEFELRCKAAGLPLLLNQSASVQVRGRMVQFLGMTWGRRDGHHEQAMQELLPQRIPDAFTILLSHHPHAFDVAAAAGIPLTLSGHTHGGQLMLNERLGVGPVMFRYWSGLYRKQNAALIVNNGIGNWFPLRIQAPAEIIHLTLHRA
jgi:predicted MPP superfamily phosphohydrolase